MLTRSLPKRQWAAAMLVATLILGCLAFRAFNQRRPLPCPAPLPVVVDIAGDVRRPGRYALPGPTVSLGDALHAAGGLTNRATGSLPGDGFKQPLTSGTTLRAKQTETGAHEITVEPMPASTRLILGIKLDVNEASLEDLLCVPRMRPETARAIVDIRDERPWSDLNDLVRIPGVGPKTVNKWESFLSVQSNPP